MNNNDVESIREVYISRKDKKENDIFELQKRVLKKYIDSRIDEIEESFKILCDEFADRLNKKENILLNRKAILSSIPKEFSSSVEVFLWFLKNGYRPKKFKNSSIIELLNVLYKKNSDWFTVSENSIVFKDKDEVKKYFWDKAEKQEFYFLPKINDILNGKKIEADDDFLEKFKQELLECEKIRCALPDIFSGRLTEINSGHWDLFDYNEQRKDDCWKIVTIPEDKPIYFRNPHLDFDNSLVAIDFGTKSTVVIYKNEKSESIPVKLSVNMDITDNKNKDLYENPTIMHFINFNNFINDYNSKEGRPDTKWSDLTIAHEAINELEQGKFESFFIDLKSWCSSKKKNKLKDEKGKELNFSAFLDLCKLNEPNPVEYYAYFLGLYINNMSVNKHIFKNYRMSFPISFPNELREAIIASFKKGIRKSFPTSILADKKFDTEFNVKEGYREPIAYAITALNKYHFNDKVENGEQCPYAVFDFGGGTTDFDFGIYSLIDENDPIDPNNDYHDYKITRLGEGDMPHLGGEKLLKYLAFEVLKANVNEFKDYSQIIPFTTYEGCIEKEYEMVRDYIVDDSTSAKRNMRILMEKLRWIWEEIEPQTSGEQDIYNEFKNGIIKNINLFNDSGEEVQISQLVLTNNEDEGQIRIDFKLLLRKKIEEGIEEFFNSLLANFKKSPMKNIDEISIFLAGNSTKSKLFNRILSEYLGSDYEYNYNKDNSRDYESNSEDEEKKVKELVDINKKAEKVVNIKNQLGNENLKFVVYPPLKTKEAKEKLISMGYDLNLNDSSEPSGKTGVAYGMLVDRVRVDDINAQKGLDVAFRFYVGIAKRNKLVELVINKNEGFGEWKKLRPVNPQMTVPYYFYYTKSDEAISKKMPINTNTPRAEVPVIDPQDDTFIFIRALEPNVVQWQVADSIENCKDLDENVNRITLGD